MVLRILSTLASFLCRREVVDVLVLPYLCHYVKDLQKGLGLLKTTHYKEEVLLLENVELNLEAFDYLQLPFALKQGRVGRLSIKNPWIGPIVIILEDVFICASNHKDQDAEKRESVGKKTKLAGVMENLSKSVYDSQAWQNLISFIKPKILDCIQVSLKNCQILYHGMHGDSVWTIPYLGYSFFKNSQAGLANSMIAQCARIAR